MAMFRKKAITIDARRFLNDASSYGLLNWINEGQRNTGREFATWHNNAILVPTLESTLKASTGDWIIRGVHGEFYPCKSEIFYATYEFAEPLDAD